MYHVTSTEMKLYIWCYLVLLDTAAAKSSLRVATGRLDKGNLRVINGRLDTENDFPFAVILEQRLYYVINNLTYVVSSRVCTGSLITDIWVITAAHCTTVAYDRVRYGAIHASPIAPNTFSDVLERIPHPNFDATDLRGAGFSVTNDVALTLITPIPLKKTFAKISAADYQSLLGFPVKLAGYGRDDISDPMVKIQPLQVADGVVVKCEREIVGNAGPVICLASQCNRQQLVYNGDSGGPLLVQGKLVGVASYSTLGAPSLGYYWPISPYLQWVQDTMRYTKVPVQEERNARFGFDHGVLAGNDKQLLYQGVKVFSVK